MNFCPRCGTPLVSQMEGGRERPACPAPDCRYFHFGDYSIGCGGVVIRDGKGLLIQRGINPNRGAWQLPGGYVEADEDIVEAVQREVLEEAGVEAKGAGYRRLPSLYCRVHRRTQCQHLRGIPPDSHIRRAPVRRR